METKISKAQIEVWEWKEHLYEQMKNLKDDQKLEYIHNKVKDTIEKYFKHRKKIIISFLLLSLAWLGWGGMAEGQTI